MIWEVNIKSNNGVIVSMWLSSGSANSSLLWILVLGGRIGQNINGSIYLESIFSRPADHNKGSNFYIDTNLSILIQTHTQNTYINTHTNKHKIHTFMHSYIHAPYLLKNWSGLVVCMQYRFIFDQIISPEAMVRLK